MNFLQEVQNKAISIGHSYGERLIPVLKESKFIEKGVLTPEEFVIAGNQLVRTSPTWKWYNLESGDDKRLRDILPKEKQFLITKNVPCRKRVAELATDFDKQEENVVEKEKDEWVPLQNPVKRVETTANNVEDAGTSYVDLDDLEEPDLASGLEQAHKADEDTLKTRTYDLFITYDKYYQTPRMWILGYNKDNSLLQPKQMLEDVMQDYTNKTVTLEKHPHLSSKISYATIHPCRHASVMKKIMDRMEKPTVEQYLFVFLKFLQSVIPTIEYDFTVQIKTK
eukprot:snap_masked-scaffold_2-processed-gene-25.30-mRNA-1 protein AED:0.03 eAED:0.03 QI:0/0.5/0.33/1/1/1/3/18/280